MFFLNYFEAIFGNYYLLLSVTCLSFFIKIFIFIALVKKTIHSPTIKYSYFFLLLIIIGSAVNDSAWILKLSQLLFIPNADYRIILFWIRIMWGFQVVQFHATSLFIESLVTKKYIIPFRQKIYSCFSLCFILFFVSLAFLNFNCTDASERSLFELTTQKLVMLYYLFPLMIPSFFIAIRKIRSDSLPHILKKQLKLLIQAIIIPHWISEFINSNPFMVYQTNTITQSFAFESLSTIFITYAILYCARRIMGLRFLNLKSHVQQSININFINDFKDILGRLSLVTNIRELSHITQSFFKETFNIHLSKTKLYLRKIDTQKENEQTSLIENNTTSLVETFISTNKTTIEAAIKKQQILIYDEVDFTHFYNETTNSNAILNFLDTINADIFLPIYEKDKLIAYIIIDRYARNTQFYSNMERDEMIVFASYLGNTINLLQNKILDALIEQEQNLRKELYHKHQEINQYKESIRSFLRTNKQKQIGIIFYKNRHFTFGNQAAKELVEININKQQGHPLSQAFKHITQQVEAYKAPQSMLSKDTHGTTIVLSAVPHLEQNTIILTVSYPDVSDIIKQQIDLLKDPTELDYLLYLQTTESGKLINQLIPGTGQTLLNFKIELLKIALSRKAILLDMPEQDLLPTVELLHHINLRDTLQVLTLQGLSQNFDIAIKLFGINPIFGVNTKGEKPLLEKLDNTGTIFIKNIHFLDQETQEYLAEFIRYGFYRIFKSEQKIPSNVRIICSSNQTLQHLTQEGKFSKSLFQELRQTTIAMPSLLTLPENELNTLADGFTEQALQSNAFQNLLGLTDKEKNKLAHKRPASLQELKNKVQQILINKSKKNQIYQETQFDPAYEITDPDLIQAVRLGKQALKDQKIMALLWNKFKNQNKIATFLGVNRSSVNRRCKEYNLQ